MSSQRECKGSCVHHERPVSTGPSWSSGLDSCFSCRRPGFDSRRGNHFLLIHLMNVRFRFLGFCIFISIIAIFVIFAPFCFFSLLFFELITCFRLLWKSGKPISKPFYQLIVCQIIIENSERNDYCTICILRTLFWNK